MKCHTTMLVGNMDLARLITYAEQLEGEKLRKKRSWDSKNAHIEDEYQGEGVGVQASPTCHMCGRNHLGDYLVGSSACFGYGVMDHKMRHYPWIAKNDNDKCHLS